jgi:hypothetical protein
MSLFSSYWHGGAGNNSLHVIMVAGEPSRDLIWQSSYCISWASVSQTLCSLPVLAGNVWIHHHKPPSQHLDMIRVLEFISTFWVCWWTLNTVMFAATSYSSNGIPAACSSNSGCQGFPISCSSQHRRISVFPVIDSVSHASVEFLIIAKASDRFV